MKFFVVASALVAAAYGAADPALLYGAYRYGLPLAYGAKSAPCVNAANVPVPCAAGAYGYGLPYGYAGHYIGKREAEAEADPALLYGAYGYGAYGYPYTGAFGYGLPYAFGKSAPCVNAANVPVPCA